jgi:hypothetical protein
MTIKHDKAWRAALKERGITAAAIESKIMEAWQHPNILNEDVEDAKLAFQRSYLLFVQSLEGDNALIRELSMTEGQRAFDCGKLLHTKLTLEPLHAARCAVTTGGRKGAERRKQELAGNELRPRIVDAIGRYTGAPHKMASTLAKRFKCSSAYIRQIKNETPLP